jgi:hypothetical protein
MAVTPTLEPPRKLIMPDARSPSDDYLIWDDLLEIAKMALKLCEELEN